ncbi:MAG: VWA domain-containing protein [Halomonas sp.]|uniref:vWA domain-containing protein n=1 Tax=Halomonas sp. TaxID=1486246 RepID=UPI0019E146FF|nr:vWA domain-containing protein [Halomonas sp.]MBE0488117.1 VWA domain-containing protein [Halomonas sp.]
MAQPVEENPDVRVIIDVSGSMRSNDPDQLAASALELLAALLPDGTPAGVWTFGERVDTPLPLDPVDDGWRERAMALRPALVEYQQHTDIEAAVREAAESPANGWRHLVLLTDGMIDLSPARGTKPEVDLASRRTLLEELAPALARRGVVVHAIAFSDAADLALVERLSRMTGGLPAMVHSPESLLGAFVDIVERIFPADQVPLVEGRFSIEPGVEAFSALLFHAPDAAPLTLVAPDGTRHDPQSPPPGARWQVEPRFDLLRVPDPAPGEWRLEGEIADDSRIGVRGAVSLQLAPLPAVIHPGLALPLEAWLARGGEPWEAAPEDLAIGAALLDGEDTPRVEVEMERQGDRFVGELTVPELSGAARLRLHAQGQGIVRQRYLAVNVQSLLSLMDDAEEGLGLAGGAGLSASGERFHEDLATGREGEAVPDSAADRFIEFINDLPAQAAALWREGRPWLERRGAAFAGDPRQWAVAGLVVLTLLILLAWRHRRRPRRAIHREDPYV